MNRSRTFLTMDKVIHVRYSLYIFLSDVRHDRDAYTLLGHCCRVSCQRGGNTLHRNACYRRIFRPLLQGDEQWQVACFHEIFFQSFSSPIIIILFRLIPSVPHGIIQFAHHIDYLVDRPIGGERTATLWAGCFVVNHDGIGQSSVPGAVVAFAWKCSCFRRHGWCLSFFRVHKLFIILSFLLPSNYTKPPLYANWWMCVCCELIWPTLPTL